MTDTIPPSRFTRPPILDVLRARTANAHERLENSLPFTNPDLDLTTYSDLLARFHAFYLAMEPRLAAVAGLREIGLDVAERSKIPLLERDLRALGSEPLRAAWDLPETATTAAALGCMYVLEGSTLGGRFITRHLATLGITPDTGGAFFSGYGERTGEMWRAFSDAIGRFAARHPESTNEIVLAADTTFTLLDRWLAAASS